MANEPKPQPVPESIARFHLEKLPSQALLDTGVWMRALGWTNDDRTKLCRELVEAIEYQKLRALMASPTLAELLRYDESYELPERRHINVVAFDKAAAVELQRLTAPFKNDGPPGDGRRMKFDPLIIACAVRWKASVVISLDADFHKAAPRALDRGMLFKRPLEYLLPVEQEIERSKEKERGAAGATAKLVTRQGTW